MKAGKIKKPVVAWVSGTCAKLFKSEVQFGHAGAKSGGQAESAQVKQPIPPKGGRGSLCQGILHQELQTFCAIKKSHAEKCNLHFENTQKQKKTSKLFAMKS